MFSDSMEAPNAAHTPRLSNPLSATCTPQTPTKPLKWAKAQELRRRHRVFSNPSSSLFPPVRRNAFYEMEFT